jgi:hypothetical protein
MSGSDEGRVELEPTTGMETMRPWVDVSGDPATHDQSRALTGQDGRDLAAILHQLIGCFYQNESRRCRDANIIGLKGQRTCTRRAVASSSTGVDVYPGRLNTGRWMLDGSTLSTSTAGNESANDRLGPSLFDQSCNSTLPTPKTHTQHRDTNTIQQTSI